MRILVCVWDFPYPARGGGRGDVWRRIEAFVRLGHQVMLVNLFDPDGPRVPTPEGLAYVDSVVESRFSFPIKRSRERTLKQLLGMWRVPWHVATRIPDDEERAVLDRKIADFGPDLVWLDGPWFGELGLRLHAQRGVPLAYRSHNVEHIYLRRQAGASVIRRDQIAWRLACVGLKSYQLKLMKASRMVFDISLDDMMYWRHLGVTNNHWLPPLPELALTEPSTERVTTDVLFVGGLRTPNNQQGVRWLVGRVLPLVVAQRPEVTFAVVGSYPEPGLVAELASVAAVRTWYDVPDVTPYQFGARVLVNPVAVGSGVQVKMLDMLMTDAPIVTRSQGLSGLPPSCADQFEVADTEAAFAAAVLRRLDDPGVEPASRAAARRQFSLDGIADALAALAR